MSTGLSGPHQGSEKQQQLILIHTSWEPAATNNAQLFYDQGFPGLSGKESTCQCKRCEFDPHVRKIPWRRRQQPPPVSLSGKSHGQRSLAGTSLWGYKESDRTLRLNNNNNNAYSGLLMFVIDYQKVIGDGEVSAATSRHSL